MCKIPSIVRIMLSIKVVSFTWLSKGNVKKVMRPFDGTQYIRVKTVGGLEFVADVAETKSCPIDIDIFTECDDFKQLSHFMLVD